MTPPSVPPHLDFNSGTIVRGRRIDHRIIRRLGKPGGYGVVYEAEDQHNREHVALKFLKEEPQGEDLSCLWREVGLGQTIDHPNVVWINGIGNTADNITYISMELVSGEDLEKLLGRINRLPPETAIAYAIELCQGLDAIHRKRVVHRDLKPANVMLDDHGHAK